MDYTTANTNGTRAPKGGVKITDGVLYEKDYKGGQFLPNGIPASARKAKRALKKVEAGTVDCIKVTYMYQLRVWAWSSTNRYDSVLLGEFKVNPDNEQAVIAEAKMIIADAISSLDLPVQYDKDLEPFFSLDM